MFLFVTHYTRSPIFCGSFIPMVDLGFVRDHLELVEEKLRQRGMDPGEVLRDFRELDARRRKAIHQAETVQAEKNRASEEIARLKKNKEDAAGLIEQNKAMREQIERLTKEAESEDAAMRDILSGIPNLPQDSVPVGHDEHANVEVRRWGAPPEFGFVPKPHWELGEQLGVLDLPRAAKVSGARFAVY